MITGNPIIIVDNNYNDLHQMPSELNVLDIVDRYNGKDDISISSIVYKNLKDEMLRDKYLSLLNNCFYFNDGEKFSEVVRLHKFTSIVN